MRWSRLSTLLLALLLLAGCGSDNESRDTGEALEEDAERTRSLELSRMPGPDPGQPVWEEDATFNDSTRYQTLYIRTAGLNAIYERARLDHGQELRGMVNVRMVILPDGSVQTVELLDEEWNDPYAGALTDSMLALIEQWTFPPGLEKPVALTQPFRFGDPE